MNRTSLLLSALALFCISGTSTANAQDLPTPVPGALFSLLQIERGEKAFKNVCGACHATTQFVSPEFVKSWNERPVFELFEQLRTTMPQDNPGNLPRQDYIDVIGYLLKLNGAEVGEVELLPEDSVLKASRIKLLRKEPGSS